MGIIPKELRIGDLQRIRIGVSEEKRKGGGKGRRDLVREKSIKDEK